MEVFPTGLRGIDHDLRSGGLPAGSVVSVEYPPASAGEALLWTLVARGFHPEARRPAPSEEATVVRPDHVWYLTSGKSPATVSDGLATHAPPRADAAIGLPLDVACIDAAGGDVEPPASIVDSEAQRPAFVIDAASDLLAADGPAARDIIATARSAVRDRDGIALLSFARGDRPWLDRERHELQRCDGHVRFEPGAGAASAAVRFSHLRGAAGPVGGFPAVFDLDVGRRVTVDTIERG